MNIAIVGCGAIAKMRHAPAVFSDPDAVLYAVCDPFRENADALAGEYQTKAVYDITDVLSDPNVDAVIICTPERFHCDHVVAALNAGKDVLCEKPLAMNPEEGRRIIKAVEKSGRRLMVAFAQRLNDEHVLAKSLLEQGVIGKPLAFRTVLAHRGVEYATIDQPSPDFYDRKLAGIGDVMLSVGCHRVDLIPYLFDSPIKAVDALTAAIDKRFSDGSLINAPDHAMINAELENGMVGTIWISWCDYGRTERQTMVYGTEGTMRIYEEPGIVVHTRSGEKKTYEVHPDPNGWQAITHHFIGVLNGKEKPVCDGYDGLNCLLVMDAVKRSAAGKHRVEISSKRRYPWEDIS